MHDESSMQSRSIFGSSLYLVFLAVFALLSPAAEAAFKAILQGQSAASSTWTTSGLQGWKELDYVPCRVYLTGGPASNKVITVEFQHIQGRIPAIQNLSGFTNSGNVQIVSVPVLSAPASSNYWSYSFTVTVRDTQAGWVSFKARLAAGSHDLTTSGITLRGTPALGTLTICRPARKSGLPDLKLVKTGPAQAAPGEVITYSLSYSNKASANCPATGVQINDIFSPQVTLVTASLPPKTEVVGNMIFIDIGSLAVKASGRLSYSVQVNANAANGTQFNNSAEIVSAEDECKPEDNYSCVVTRVVAVANQPPAANPDNYSVNEDTTLNVTAPGVLGNDADPNGDTLTATLVTGTQRGSLTLNSNGSFIYNPTNYFFGTDTFTYRASDGKTSSAPATVTITIHPLNNAPVAINDSYTTPRNTQLTISAPGVLANDSDVEGSSLSAVRVTNPAHGLLSFNPDGSFAYRPNNNFVGTDSFTYKASDGSKFSGVATVTIVVSAVNDRPVAVNDNYTIPEDTVLHVMGAGVLLNDSDANGDALLARLITGPAHGALTFNADGTFVYQPVTNFHGTDSFTYVANDGELDSLPATVTIIVTPANDGPAAADDAYTVAEDTTLSVPGPGVLLNDTDADGDVLRAILVTGPSHGALTLNADGSFTYTPGANFNGNDSFTYKANDGDADSSVRTVSIAVLPVNDAPSFSMNSRIVLQLNAGRQVLPNWAYDISAGPPDEAGQTLTFIVTTDNPSLFAAGPSISPDGTLDFTPANDVYGTATVTVVLEDDAGTERGGINVSPPQTFTIVINNPPTVRIVLPTNDSVFITKMPITVVAEATDLDGQIAHVDLFQGTNLLSRRTEAPYFHVIPSLPAGTYQFGARATDDLGATADAVPVSITVLDFAPHAAGPFVLNRQTGLFEQTVRVTNPTPEDFAGIRLMIRNVRTQVTVWNKTGQTNGIPYIDTKVSIPAGGHVDILVTYHAPDVRVPPEPIFEAVPFLVTPKESVTRITRCDRQANGDFRIEFTAKRGKMHCVQFSDDLVRWQTAPGMVCVSPTMSWIDTTASNARYYRVIVLP